MPAKQEYARRQVQRSRGSAVAFPASQERRVDTRGDVHGHLELEVVPDPGERDLDDELILQTRIYAPSCQRTHRWRREATGTHRALDVMKREGGRTGEGEGGVEGRALDPNTLRVRVPALCFLHRSAVRVHGQPLARGDVHLHMRCPLQPLLLVAAQDVHDVPRRRSAHVLCGDIELPAEHDLDVVRRERHGREDGLVGRVGVGLDAGGGCGRCPDGDGVGNVREEREDGDGRERELQAGECIGQGGRARD